MCHSKATAPAVFPFGRRYGSPLKTTSFTAGRFRDTGKVKRIRQESARPPGECSARGHIRGGWIAAEARVLASPDDLRKQMKRMRAKYGLLFLPFAWWPRLTRTATCVIEFTEASDTT